MKNRRLLFAAAVLGTLALALTACSVRSGGPGAALAPALDIQPQNGGRALLELPGFGRVALYSDTSGTGRPLLLLPSVNAAASAYEMRPLFAAYRGQRPVYVLEWPGFGGSDRPDVRYTPALMVSALETALDAVAGSDAGKRAGGVDVVALSQAGEFAARAALSDPRIHTLALISPTGLSAKASPSAEESERLYGTLSSPFVSVPFYWLLTRRFVIELFLKRSFVGAPDPDLVEYAAQSTRQPGAVHAPIAFVAGLLRTPDAYGELYARLQLPTLLLYDRDGYVSFERLPQLTGQKSNISAQRIAPSLGLPQFEQLPALKAALDRFWAGS